MNAEVVVQEIAVHQSHEEVIARAWESLKSVPDDQDRMSRFLKVAKSVAVAADRAESTLCVVNEYAFELMSCLDAKQPNYQPRPHEEVVEMLHGLADLLWSDDQDDGREMASDLAELGGSPTSRHLPPEFSAAMHRHVELAELHGEDSQEARRSFMRAMQIAPDWFKAEVDQMANDMKLLPQPSGYLADGSPMYSLDDVAKHLEVPPGKAEAAMHEMLADRQALGLPVDGLVTASDLIHRRQ